VVIVNEPWLKEEDELMRNTASLNARDGGVNKNKTTFYFIYDGDRETKKFPDA
jgi:hypothetical protein